MSYPPFARGLYAIADLGALGERDPCRFASTVLDRGAVVLQLRAKWIPAGDLLPIARSLSEICRARGVPFLVNDRVDLAVASGADGVHVGQDDLCPREVREMVRGTPVRIVGVSTHDLAQVDAAIAAGADYLGYGPVFPTAGKPGHDAPVGISGVAQCVLRSTVPVVAVGGIDPRSARDLCGAGAHAVAVIGALARAEDPGAVAERFREAFL